MAATLTEVAKRAGVSLATASRAFGDPGRVSADTRRLVLAAAEALGYEGAGPSGARTFGLIVPDVSNAMFASMIKSIQERAWPSRHRMVLADAAESAQRERECLASLAATVDGIISCSPRVPAEAIRRLIGSTPLIVINGEAEWATQIHMEVETGLRQAVEHLHALGHRKVAFVPGPEAAWANTRRLEAVRRYCAERKVSLAVVGHQAASIDGGRAAAASVAASGATAVIAYNDLVAIGLIAGGRALGLRCPEDLSVVGVDDLEISSASHPGLTSVRVATERSGSIALDLLIEQIGGKPRIPEVIQLGSQLIVRGSTAGPALPPEIAS